MTAVGIPELVLVLVMLVLLFGARRVPEIARSLGQAIGALRHETDGPSPGPGNEPPP